MVNINTKVELKRLSTTNGDQFQPKVGLKKRHRLFADNLDLVARLYGIPKGKRC